MITRHTSLSRNIVQFCRFLRQHKFVVGFSEETDALNALQTINYSNPATFRLALQAVLCRSRTQIADFESLYYQYWRETAQAVDARVKNKKEMDKKPVATAASFTALKAWLNGNNNTETEQVASFSVQENLSQKDFSRVPAEDLPELMQLIKALSRRLAAQVARRYERTSKPLLPDLRRTLRRNMRRGGELMDLLFQKPKQNRMNLVVLCDVSKSMDLYTTFLLQFMYAFQQVYRRMEAFVFGTTLQHITPLLQQHDFIQAMRLLSEQGDSWSSGTRIGESLHRFVTDYAPRVLNKRSIVIILSDGWDTGEKDKLAESMKAIKARSKKIIWLNPLAGYPSYQPQTAGMQAALPFVDVLAPVHNADSLRRLGRLL